LIYHIKREIPRYNNCLNAISQQYGHIKSLCFRKARCVKCAEDYPTFNCPCKNKSKDIKCMLREDNYPANYKGCIYKDLQRTFFSCITRKIVAVKLQPRTELASIQTILVQPGRSYASITRTENKEPTISQNNQFT